MASSWAADARRSSRSTCARTAGWCSSPARPTSSAARCSPCSSGCTASAASPPAWPRSSSSWPAPAARWTTSPPRRPGARARTSRELVDLTELVETYAPAWRTLAAGYGAELRVEPPLIVTRFEPEERSTARLRVVAAPRRRPPAPPRREPVAPDAASPHPRPPAAGAAAPGRASRPASPIRARPPRPRSSGHARPPGVCRPTARPTSPTRARPCGVAESRRPPASPPAVHAAPAPATRDVPGPAAATTVFADPLRIAQACANLVGNAAEHGGGVGARSACGRRATRCGSRSPTTGPACPMSVSALTATARARRGRRGHGLAIAAAIAEHHGGRLHAAPSDSGARLMLEMPAAHEPVRRVTRRRRAAVLLGLALDARDALGDAHGAARGGAARRSSGR